MVKLGRFIFLATALSSSSAFAVELSDTEAQRLLSMSMAELSNISVTSVSKKAEPENEAAAAIFVITQDDIKRAYSELSKKHQNFHVLIHY